MFERGYYYVDNGHANTMPMITLLEIGGTQFYGLYRLLFEVTLLSRGIISDRDFKFLCLTKGKMDIDTQVDDFLNVCIEQKLMVPFEGEEGEFFYSLPEVGNYLKFVEAKERQRKEAQRKGGLLSAQKKAENQEPDCINY